TRAQYAIDEQGVCFLGSDVDANGGKLIFTSGAPVNTGSDEERMLLALRRIAGGEGPIPFGIGVNRGDVFAGDIGPWYRRTYTVMGDDVNLAARLMAQAGTHEIYATADVLERSGTRFETAALEPFAVKGKTHPVQAWSVGEAVGSRSRETTTLDRLPLVGRDREMGLLMEALEQRSSGDGGLVEIVGEPGIGKTRLLEELRGRSEGLLLLRATCEAYTASTPYAVWRELLRELIDVGWEDPDDVVLERVYGIISTREPSLVPWMPLVLLAMDVEVPATPEVEMLGEEYVRGKLHESLLRFLAIVLDEPALIEIEDVHHMDDASAELLRYLVQHPEGHPWLFCVTRRQAERGFVGTASPSAHVVEPAVLEPDDALRLTEAASERYPLPPHALVTVAQRSGGNPQFLQDLVVAAVESGGAEGLPDSVEAAAMARIDRLAPDDRALVRRASVLGVSMHPRTLSWVLDEDTPLPDEQAWVRLSEFFEDDGDGFVKFRRALLRDAAYEGLPFRLRRSLHASVAVRLQGEPGGGDDQIDALSLHTFLAERYDEAWRYSRTAGDLAIEKAAPFEAARFYRRALDAVRRAAETLAPVADVASVSEQLGEALIRVGELEAASDSFAKARTLLSDDPISGARLLLRQALTAERMGRTDLALRRSRRAASLVEGIGGSSVAALRAKATMSQASARLVQGQIANAADLAQEAMDEAKRGDDPTVFADAAVVLDWSLSALGRGDEATHLPEALGIYEAAGDQHSVATVELTLGALAYFQGRWDEAIGHYQEVVEINERLGDPVLAANGMLNIAEVLSDQGHWQEAEERARHALRVARGAKEENSGASAEAYLGRVMSRSGRGEEAAVLLTVARDTFTALRADSDVVLTDSWLAECALFRGRWQDAERSAGGLTGADGASAALLSRVRGIALARLGDETEARTTLEEALQAAEEEQEAFEQGLIELAIADLWPNDPSAHDHRRNAAA
ncbi:MAG TPA: AAA family ATPase, partial [Actinomycetota bacterium]